MNQSDLQSDAIVFQERLFIYSPFFLSYLFEFCEQDGLHLLQSKLSQVSRLFAQVSRQSRWWSQPKFAPMTLDPIIRYIVDTPEEQLLMQPLPGCWITRWSYQFDIGLPVNMKTWSTRKIAWLKSVVGSAKSIEGSTGTLADRSVYRSILIIFPGEQLGRFDVQGCDFAHDVSLLHEFALHFPNLKHIALQIDTGSHRRLPYAKELQQIESVRLYVWTTDSAWIYEELAQFDHLTYLDCSHDVGFSADNLLLLCALPADTTTLVCAFQPDRDFFDALGQFLSQEKRHVRQSNELILRDIHILESCPIAIRRLYLNLRHTSQWSEEDANVAARS